MMKMIYKKVIKDKLTKSKIFNEENFEKMKINLIKTYEKQGKTNLLKNSILFDTDLYPS
jgi:hypothetical protein